MSKSSVDASAAGSRMVRFAARARAVLEVAAHRPADQRLLPSIGAALVDQWVATSPRAARLRERLLKETGAAAPDDATAPPTPPPSSPADPAAPLSFKQMRFKLLEGTLTPEEQASIDWGKVMPKLDRLGQIAVKDLLQMPLHPFEQQELDAMRAKLYGPGSDPHGEEKAEREADAAAAAAAQAGREVDPAAEAEEKAEAEKNAKARAALAKQAEAAAAQAKEPAGPPSFAHAPTGAPRPAAPPEPRFKNQMWDVGEAGQVSAEELVANSTGLGVDPSTQIMAEVGTAGE